MEKMNNQYPINRIIGLLFLTILLINTACEDDKEVEEIKWVISDYNGTYESIAYDEELLGSFAPGIYVEKDIPQELKQLAYGRMEIEFKYNGGALKNFMPILYYGSINRITNDNIKEETQDHLVVEIGHYNVVPYPLENLFYTICYDRYPEYCRDTYIPVVSGENYRFILDKKPEGILLQLKKGETIVNSFPSAFFADSAQLFFKDVTNKINKIRGDSLDIVMMIGKGFVGFEKGLRDFNGSVGDIRIYKYTLSDEPANYEIKYLNNQHLENQIINYVISDRLSEDQNTIKIDYEFESYVFNEGVLIPNTANNRTGTKMIPNNQTETYNISQEDIGLYKLHLKTIDKNNEVVNASSQAIEVWVYPEEWYFEY